MAFYRAIGNKALGASLLMMVLASCGKQPEAQAPPPAVPVVIQDLASNDVKQSTKFNARLEAKQRVALAPRVDGRVLEIAVQEGDQVKQGDLIVQLQLSREQGEVLAAQSEVNVQQANVRNAEAELRIAEAEVASAEAQVEQGRADLREKDADLALAETNMTRTEFLVREGAQSRQTLDDRTRDINAAKSQRDALAAALNSNLKALRAAKERVDAARSAIAGQKAALKQSEALVAVAAENLDFNRIVAPIDGVVGDIVPKVGDYLEAGDNVTSIIQDDALELRIGVPVEQASRLAIGLPVEIIDRQGKAIAEGDINFISPRTDRSSQAILVKAAFNNSGRLRDDTSVMARIIWSDQPGILIPTEAVSRIAGKSFVFVAQEREQEDGSTALIAEQRPVELGSIQGQSYQVLSGLELGDRLITSGILNLADGTLIDPESATVTSQGIE
ncbi:MAG: efflux RND transporter periplasmic adaptor subunit [Cyanobacteria bacterium P01_A01_bin.40]